MEKYKDTVFEHLHELYEKKSGVKNISTCIDYIDSCSGGIDSGTLTTILGFTGSRENNICYQYSL